MTCSSDDHCSSEEHCQGGQCVSSVETCDALDNDEDGSIDEGVGNACGECGPLPEEICGGLDDDCDGTVDEGFESLGESCDLVDEDVPGVWVCQGGALACLPLSESEGNPEVCDAVDNDLDGRVDEELELPLISCTQESCRESSTQRCVDGALVNDCDAPPSESDESCDGVDDDCDGTVDEDSIEQTVSCGSTCGVSAQASCQGGELVDDCATAVAALVESCDGQDNDCDERIDEGLDQWSELGTSCGVGVCASTLKSSCVQGELVERCSDQPELSAEEDPLSPLNRSDVRDDCDGADDDCDGATDEDSIHELRLCALPNGAVDRQSARCSDGLRTRTECGIEDNICLETGEPFDEMSCEFRDSDLADGESVDENGDGLDGLIDLAIFVHPSLGSDEGDGRPEAPMQSLSAAIERVRIDKEQRPLEAGLKIFLAQGSYTIDPMTVTFDLSIMGGYVARSENGTISWTRPTMLERTSDETLRSVIRTDLPGPLFTVRSADISFELDAVRLSVGDGDLTLGEGARSSLGLALLSCEAASLREVQIAVGDGANGRPGLSPSPVIVDPALYRGGDARSATPGVGGLNRECCPNDECRGGSGGLLGGSGENGSPRYGTEPGDGGLAGTLFDFQGASSVIPAADGQTGLQGADATRDSLLGAIDVTTGSWVRLSDGVPAERGRPGGGGGGGAGHFIELLPEPSLGGTGGGGGAGGCGGEPGGNGESGGWSVGITLDAACALTVSELIIEKGRGGAGGLSGGGGSGERGGEGGLAAPEHEDHQGGAGGDGGCGGHGVSGHGGSSIGVILLNSAAENGFNFTSIGGSGGLSGALTNNANCERRAGPKGFDGLSLEWLCCTPRSLGDPLASCNLCLP